MAARKRKREHITGGQVGLIAAGMAGGLILVSRLSSELDLGFLPSRVGNAGEWFSGVAAAAVLAWTIGEPARSRHREDLERAERASRREAWQTLYLSLRPFDMDETPREFTAKVARLVDADERRRFLEWRDGGGRAAEVPKPERAASGEKLALSRAEMPQRFREAGQLVVSALETLVNDLRVEQLTVPLVVIRRAFEAAKQPGRWWPYDIDEATRLAIEDRDEEYDTPMFEMARAMGSPDKPSRRVTPWAHHGLMSD